MATHGGDPKRDLLHRTWVRGFPMEHSWSKTLLRVLTGGTSHQSAIEPGGTLVLIVTTGSGA